MSEQKEKQGFRKICRCCENALKDNLSILYSPYHQRIHNEGKIISKSKREAVIRQNHLRKGERAKIKRCDLTHGMVYKMSKIMSFNKISIKTKLDWGCVKQRYNDFIHDNPELLEGGEA